MHSIQENEILRIEGLRTYFFTPYGVVKAVDGVSFELRKSECLCIVGESGSGKSTVGLSVLRLFDDTARIVDGKIIFRGMNLVELPDKEIRKIRGNEIAMIFQDPMSSLNPVLRVGEQIVEQIVEHTRMSRKEAKEKAISLLKEVGIQNAEKRVNEYPHQFSGGMRQRVMVAMAISCNPEIIIADEPTSALDVTIQAQILDMFEELKNKGISIIFITHDFGIVSEIADRVVVMYAGKVVEKADAEEIFEKPLHPYTKGLIDCIPRISERRKRLPYIPGTIPSLINPPEGCVFNPRCQFRFEPCTKASPPEYRITEKHSVACYLYSSNYETP